MLILSVMLSFLQVASCNEGTAWEIQPKEPLEAPAVADAWAVAEKEPEPGSSSRNESSSDSDDTSSSSDENISVAKATSESQAVDPESRRVEESHANYLDQHRIKDFVSENSEDIQTLALICCGFIAVAVCAPVVLALLGGVSVGAVGLGVLACLCSPVIIVGACCCCCLMLLGYGHK